MEERKDSTQKSDLGPESVPADTGPEPVPADTGPEPAQHPTKDTTKTTQQIREDKKNK